MEILVSHILVVMRYLGVIRPRMIKEGNISDTWRTNAEYLEEHLEITLSHKARSINRLRRLCL